MKIEQGYTKAQMTWLMMLRLFYRLDTFMYEGLVKIMNPKLDISTLSTRFKGSRCFIFYQIDSRRQFDDDHQLLE